MKTAAEIKKQRQGFGVERVNGVGRPIVIELTLAVSGLLELALMERRDSLMEGIEMTADPERLEREADTLDELLTAIRLATR